jgi:hypothetical protein
MSNGNGHPASLTEYLESRNQSTPPTLQQLFDRLYEMRYQGNLTLCFAAGVPRQVVLDQPVRVPLDVKP